MTKRSLALASAAVLATAFGAAAMVGFPASDHPVAPSELGRPARASDLLAHLDDPGPLEVETIASADWEVPLSGLLNLDHPASRDAGLQDRSEPIQVYFHAVRHPSRGLFIVDTGVERALRTDPEHAAIRGLAADVMHVDRMTIHHDLGTWLEGQPEPLAGVFLTHLHLDHVSGMSDVPKGTPIYAGEGETSVRALQHLASAPIVDRCLEGQAPIQALHFEPDADQRFAGILDVFGDGTFFAIHVPGHTPGSIAYVARTKTGPVLLTGDASHTRWGWDHGVEPGTFSHDRAASAESLASLRELAQQHPAMEVRLGHQPGPEGTSPAPVAATR